MTLDSLPDLDTSGLCLVKTLSTALTFWPFLNAALRDGAHPSLFSGADGPADGPASLRFGHRPDHDAPIPVITMPIFLITIDRSR